MLGLTPKRSFGQRKSLVELRVVLSQHLNIRLWNDMAMHIHRLSVDVHSCQGIYYYI